MMSQVLINVFAIIGIGLFGGSFIILQVFKEPSKKAMEEDTAALLESGELINISTMKKDGIIDFEVIESFYKKVTDVQKFHKRMRVGFVFCIGSSLSFILSAILGSLNFSFLALMPETLGFYGIGFLILSIIYIISLIPLTSF